MTHKVGQNILVAKYRRAVYFLFSYVCVCVCEIYSTFLVSLLLISCLASCSSASFFSACREPADWFHTYYVCNKLLHLIIYTSYNLQY